MDEFFQKLEKYYSLLRDKKEAENAIMEEATYMATYYPRPKLKKIVTLNSLDELKKKLYILWGALILAVLFIIFGVGGILGDFGILFGAFGLMAAFFLPTFAIRATREFKEASSRREKSRKQNEENELWNKTEYLKLEKQYEEGYSDKKIEYEKIQAETKNKLEQINSELKNYEGFVPENYIENVYDLFEIVKNGRADNLTDAINIFENDCYQEAILREQCAVKQAQLCASCSRADRCLIIGEPNCRLFTPRNFYK